MKTNEDTIDAILAELSENYQGQFKLTEHTAKVWGRRMDGIDADAVLASVEEFCNSPSKFPPSAGQIRTRAIEMAHGEMTILTGTDAWERVTQWNRETPGHGQPRIEYMGNGIEREIKSDIELTDLENRALKQIGGSWQLSNSQNSGMDRHEFIKYFDAQIQKKTVERSATLAAKQLVESRRPALPAAETKRLPAAPVGEPTESELTDIVGKLKEGMGR